MGGPFWKSPLSIDSFIDVIMRLLFLGIVKVTRELMSDWMLECKRQNCFKQSSKNTLLPIYDIGLDWPKVLTLKKVGSVRTISGFVVFVNGIIYLYYQLKMMYMLNLMFIIKNGQ